MQLVQITDIGLEPGILNRPDIWENQYSIGAYPNHFINWEDFERWKTLEQTIVNPPSSSFYYAFWNSIQEKRRNTEWECGDIYVTPAFTNEVTNKPIYWLYWDITRPASVNVPRYVYPSKYVYLMTLDNDHKFYYYYGFLERAGSTDFISPYDIGLGLYYYREGNASSNDYIGYSLGISNYPGGNRFTYREEMYPVGQLFTGLAGGQTNPQMICYGLTDVTNFSNWAAPVGIEIIDSYDPSSGEGGEDGTFNPYGDDVDYPDLPGVSSVSSGLVKIYKPSILELSSFSEWLFATPLDQSIWTTITKLFASPFDYIISLQFLPIATNAYNRQNITMGPVDTGIETDRLTSQYISTPEIIKKVNEYYGSFADYSPSTKIMLYLPFIGFVEISADDAMAGAIGIKYNIDIMTGDCVAFVKIYAKYTKSVMYQYRGNCASQAPLNGRDFSSLIMSSLTAAANIGLTAATGGAMAPTLIKSTVSVASSKPVVNRGGSIGGNAGMLSGYVPYLIFARPAASHPASYEKFKGRPSNITATLGTLTGYTVVDSIINSGYDKASKSEIDAIDRLLREGVYF